MDGPVTRESFAAALARARLRSSATFRKLSLHVDRPVSTIHGWFKGSHLPYQRDLDVFCEVLRVIGIDDVDPWVDALARLRQGDQRPLSSSSATDDLTQRLAETESRELALQARRQRRRDAALAAQLAVEARRTADNPISRSAVIDAEATLYETRLLDNPGEHLLALDLARQVAYGFDSEDGRIHVICLRSCERAAVAELTWPQVTSFEVSPDGSHLVLGYDCEVRVVQVDEAYRCVDDYTITLDIPVGCLGFDRRGRCLIGTLGLGVLVFDLQRQRIVGRFDVVSEVRSLAVGGERFALGDSQGTVHVFNCGDEAPVVLGDPREMIVATLAFSPDHRFVAAGYRSEHLRVWDLGAPVGPVRATEVTLARHEFTTWVNKVAFSPMGDRLLAASSDSTIAMWNVGRFESRHVPLVNAGVVADAEFVDSDTVVATPADGSWRLFDIGRPAAASLQRPIWSTRVSGDGQRLSTVSRSVARVWKLTEGGWRAGWGANLDEVNARVGSSALCRSGRCLYVGESAGNIHRFDEPGSGDVASIGLTLVGATALIEMCDATPGLVVAGADDGRGYIWNVGDLENDRLTEADGAVKPSSSIDLGGYVMAARLCATGERAAFASDNGRVALVDVTDPTAPELVGELDVGTPAWAVAFGASANELLVGGDDGVVHRLAVAETGLEVVDSLIGAHGRIYDLGWHAETNCVGVACVSGALVFDLESPRDPTLHLAPQDPVYSLAFTPDGKQLIGGVLNGEIRVWQLSADTAERRIHERVGDPLSELEWRQFGPSGRYPSGNGVPKLARQRY